MLVALLSNQQNVFSRIIVFFSLSSGDGKVKCFPGSLLFSLAYDLIFFLPPFLIPFLNFVLHLKLVCLIAFPESCEFCSNFFYSSAYFGILLVIVMMVMASAGLWWGAAVAEGRGLVVEMSWIVVVVAAAAGSGCRGCITCAENVILNVTGYLSCE